MDFLSLVNIVSIMFNALSAGLFILIFKATRSLRRPEAIVFLNPAAMKRSAYILAAGLVGFTIVNLSYVFFYSPIFFTLAKCTSSFLMAAGLVPIYLMFRRYGGKRARAN